MACVWLRPPRFTHVTTTSCLRGWIFAAVDRPAFRGNVSQGWPHLLSTMGRPSTGKSAVRQSKDEKRRLLALLTEDSSSANQHQLFLAVLKGNEEQLASLLERDASLCAAAIAASHPSPSVSRLPTVAAQNSQHGTYGPLRANPVPAPSLSPRPPPDCRRVDSEHKGVGPLTFAVERGSIGAVKLLLEVGRRPPCRAAPPSSLAPSRLRSSSLPPTLFSARTSPRRRAPTPTSPTSPTTRRCAARRP